MSCYSLVGILFIWAVNNFLDIFCLPGCSPVDGNFCCPDWFKNYQECSVFSIAGDCWSIQFCFLLWQVVFGFTLEICNFYDWRHLKETICNSKISGLLLICSIFILRNPLSSCSSFQLFRLHQGHGLAHFLVCVLMGLREGSGRKSELHCVQKPTFLLLSVLLHSSSGGCGTDV